MVKEGGSIVVPVIGGRKTIQVVGIGERRRKGGGEPSSTASHAVRSDQKGEKQPDRGLKSICPAEMG